MAQSTRKGLTPSSEVRRVDDFQTAQDHYNPRFKREMSLVHSYQNMLDNRLSRPKAKDAVPVETTTANDRIKVFRNSSPELQIPHQQVFYKTQWASFHNSQHKPDPTNARAAEAERATLEGSRTFDKSYSSYGKKQIAKA